MMGRERSAAVAGMIRKKELLYTICEIYSGWVERFPLVCRKGCADCCTRSVSMSSLEGLVIADFIKKDNRAEWLRKKLASTARGKSSAVISMNQFAAACLRQEEMDVDCVSGWDLTPCFFLEDGSCTIYGVRPFGCRSFGSLVRCAETGAAEMAPIHLAVNTVFTQIIEQLSSGWGYWGNMADILADLPGVESGRRAGNIVPAQPIPGFLLAPHEKKVVRGLLRQFQEHPAAGAVFGDLIDNCMPME